MDRGRRTPTEYERGFEAGRAAQRSLDRRNARLRRLDGWGSTLVGLAVLSVAIAGFLLVEGASLGTVNLVLLGGLLGYPGGKMLRRVTQETRTQRELNRA